MPSFWVTFRANDSPVVMIVVVVIVVSVMVAATNTGKRHGEFHGGVRLLSHSNIHSDATRGKRKGQLFRTRRNKLAAGFVACRTSYRIRISISIMISSLPINQIPHPVVHHAPSTRTRIAVQKGDLVQ